MWNRSRPIAPGQSRFGDSRVSRRSCLVGGLIGFAGVNVFDFAAVCAGDQDAAAEAKVIARVQAAAKKGGLRPFEIAHSDHFLGLGDAPASFRTNALDICEGLAKAFVKDFRGRGFKLELPPTRLTVITLKDDVSFRAFIGADPGDDVGGHYDIESNQLVIFDFRDKKENQPANAERVNLFSLIHETAHLLCFNTGLLSPKADVPMCVSEGLATFVEMWRPGQTSPMSATNRVRLQALGDLASLEERWIPIAELLADDERMQEPESRQIAYAESWLLVHFLIKTPAQLPKFRAYLSGLPEGDRTAEERSKYAGAHLGSLKKFDHSLQRYARSLLRR